MADMACEATRQAALDGIGSANQVLSRASIKQGEIDRFMTVARGQRHWFSVSILLAGPPGPGRAFWLRGLRL